MKLINALFYNYRILKNAKIELNGSTTLLIGKNNSGKTTILDGLFLTLREGYTIIRRKLEPEAKIKNSINKKSTGKSFSIVLFIKMENLDIAEIVNDLKNEFTPSQVEIDYLLEKKFIITCSYEKNLGLDLTYSIEGEPHAGFPYYLAGYLEKFTEKYMDMVSKSTLYIKPDRRIPNNEKFLPFDLLESDLNSDQYICHYLLKLKQNDELQYNKFKEEFNKIFFDVSIEPSLDYNDGNVKISVKQDDLLYDINEIGSGFKYLLLILSRILVAKPRIVLIDEPDLNMHPDLLRRLVKYLRDIPDLQFIITSHHEAFVNEFEDENIRYVHANLQYSSHIKNYNESARLKLMDDLGISISNFGKSKILSSKVVLLLEGKERKYLQRLIEKKKLDQKLNSLDIFYESTFGGKRIPDFELLDKITHDNQRIVIVRDRDEYSEERIQKLIQRSKGRLFYWKRREIENYAFSYDSILKTLKIKGQRKSETIREQINKLTIADIKNILKENTEWIKKKVLILRFSRRNQFLQLLEDSDLSMHNELSDKSYSEISEYLILKVMSNQFSKENLEKDFFEQKEQLDKEWDSEGILKLSPARDLMNVLNKWIQQFGLSISIFDLIENLDNVSEDINELVNILTTFQAQPGAEEIDESDQAKKAEIIAQKELYSKRIEPNYVFDAAKSLIYIPGCYDEKPFESETDQNGNFITILDTITLERKGSMSIEIPGKKKINLKKLHLDSVSNVLYASGNFREGIDSREYEFDSYFVLDLENKKFGEFGFNKDTPDGKEGGVGDILVNPHNSKLYVALIYAEGGEPGLYIFDYPGAEPKKEKTGREGALNLFLHADHVYVLGRSDSHSTLLWFNGQVKKIDLPENEHETSLYFRNKIAHSDDSSMFVIVNHNLYLLNLDSRNVVSSIKGNNIMEVITNDLTLETFVIHNEKSGGNKYYISKITKDFELLQIYESDLRLNSIKFGPNQKNLFVFATTYSRPSNQHVLYRINLV